MYKMHHHLHILRHLHLKRILHDKYNDLVVADILRQVAIGMISVFEAIYFLKIGLPLTTVVMFDIAIQTGMIFVHYAVLKNIYRWGVKRSLIISYVLTVGFYILLYNAEFFIDKIGVFLFFIIFLSLHLPAIALYWISHHLYFFKSTRVRDTGAKIGLLMGLPAFFGIISPFLGGLIIENFTFKFLFLICSILLSAAAAALTFSEDINIKKPHLSLKEIMDFKHIRKSIIYFIQGVNMKGTGFFWPIFLFLSGIKIISIGLLYFLSNLIYSAVCLLTGRLTDRFGNRRLVQIGAIGHGISMIMRPLIVNLSIITVWQSLGGIFGAMLHIPLESGYYKYSHKHYYNEIMSRELHMHLGRISLALYFLVTLLFMPLKAAIVATLIAAGLATFMINYFMNHDKTIIS